MEGRNKRVKSPEEVPIVLPGTHLHTKNKKMSNIFFLKLWRGLKNVLKVQMK